MKRTVLAGLLAGMLVAAPCAERLDERTLRLSDLEVQECIAGGDCNVFTKAQIVGMMEAQRQEAMEAAERACALGLRLKRM